VAQQTNPKDQIVKSYSWVAQLMGRIVECQSLSTGDWRRRTGWWPGPWRSLHIPERLRWI